ncbi:RNA polymerase sigma factor [Pedobacter heparinus]|uniref:RNA polymerase sigma factor, sigma-70 family n=1 Tax=Pedobacter heparinus (strain ATCC 13125 / DSM 2366 / CIP 104194 / JCM 7457 / NBRC 12017 / NCIMB 9290 / NRRL B-14731 / HIM 762-3) TaxID=485917 RepID=C6XS86_PEDHD|nr:sigma-70 family RNA polymerase sigma factor [Pedobacter heparinus]ACU03431.1 RNA polymerase sigma factor, sigma-70 family [Pedobacter heparinus DSM 2366]
MEQEFLKHLFQQEFSKMVAVISRRFGLQHIETAEDIVSETFLLATETWGTKGLPANPAAWLYTVARQKTLSYFRRNKIFEDKVIPEIRRKQELPDQPEVLNFSQQNIKDSQLQMLFAICMPAIASEAQIGLALRILCGFGIDEIAEAFLSNKETINKRLFRAKEKLRSEKIQLVFPPENEITKRLDNVLHIIYLLFSEGYYSKTQNQILRKELCIEALRLGLMLTEYEKTNLPKTNALIALMCFHASRFDARRNTEGELVLYEEQDEKRWDTALINQGIHFLNLSASGKELSPYHLEAKIAYCHCSKEDTAEKWEEILQLYNQLLMISYSPAAALNRTFALYKANGAEPALREAEKLKLEDNHFYFVLLGELYKNIDKSKAMNCFERALALAKTSAEQQLIRQKIKEL